MNVNEPFKSINSFLNKILIENKRVMSYDTIFTHEEKLDENAGMQGKTKQIGSMSFLAIFMMYLVFYYRMVEIESSAYSLSLTPCFMALTTVLFASYLLVNKLWKTNGIVTISLLLISIYFVLVAAFASASLKSLELETSLLTLVGTVRAIPSISDEQLGALLLEYGNKTSKAAVITNIYFVSVQLSLYMNIAAFLTYSRLSKVVFLYSVTFSCTLTIIFNETEETHRSFSSLTDCANLVTIHLIVLSIKYLDDFLIKNSLNQKANLIKIKQFYHFWLQKLNICYLLLEGKEVVYKNDFFRNMLRKCYGTSKDADRFFREAKVVESYSQGIEKDSTLEECIPLLHRGTETEFKQVALFRLTVVEGATKEDFFFECRVKGYHFNYTEMLFSDTTELINSQKTSYEEKYKNILFAKIAHEFKTPIIAITELVERIKSQHNLEGEKDLKIVSNLSHYVLYLISDITSYVKSKVQCDVVREKCELVEIVAFCFNILEVLVDVNENKRANIDVELVNELKEVAIITDQVRIKQILLNFISNAVKFTVSGFIRLRLFRRGGCICISVEDSGRGISKDKLNSLKEQDIQFVVRDEYNQMGSGLGLSIAFTLAKQLGYSVESYSCENKGSTFSLVIPEEQENLNESSIDTEILDLSLKLPFETRETMQEEEFVILADDNELIRSVLNKLIYRVKEDFKKNWKIVNCTDGVFALNEVISSIQQGKKVACLILDEYMDFFSGSFTASILDSLFRDNKLGEFPIISCSAFDSACYKQKIFDSGVSYIVEKPATFDSLKDAFSKVDLI